jgi:hypothetical protein
MSLCIGRMLFSLLPEAKLDEAPAFPKQPRLNLRLALLHQQELSGRGGPQRRIRVSRSFKLFNAGLACNRDDGGSARWGRTQCEGTFGQRAY